MRSGIVTCSIAFGGVSLVRFEMKALEHVMNNRPLTSRQSTPETRYRPAARMTPPTTCRRSCARDRRAHSSQHAGADDEACCRRRLSVEWLPARRVQLCLCRAWCGEKVMRRFMAQEARALELRDG